jgi:RNA polymerase sigma-B factor
MNTRITRPPPIVHDEGWIDAALAQYALSHDQLLRDEIALESNWLATRGARHFWGRGEPFDDLVQEARIGLLKAIDRFDPGRGVEFGAFATPTIMGELRRHFRDRTWAVHVTRGMKELRATVAITHEQLAHELSSAPGVRQIATRMNVTDVVVVDAMAASRAYQTYGLDTADPARTSADEAGFGEVIDREVVASLLVHLQPRQQQILRMRFFDELTQAEIACRIGTSQVHVGRLIASSLNQLRRHAKCELVGAVPSRVRASARGRAPARG